MHIHKWTKWEPIQMPPYFSGEGLDDGQERHCTRCNYTVRERL
jgi:hypothetical protein